MERGQGGGCVCVAGGGGALYSVGLLNVLSTAQGADSQEHSLLGISPGFLKPVPG